MKNKISRREFVEGVALSTLGVSLVKVPDLVAESSNKFGSAKHVILIRLEGGMSHVDSFDPKENKNMNGGIKPISTNVEGITISEYFPLLSKYANNFSLIRGMTSKSGAHAISSYSMKTSYNKSSLIVHPTLGPIRSFLRGRIHPTLPDTVSINHQNDNPGRGYLSSEFTPLPIQNPNEGLRYSKIGVSETEFNKRMAILNGIDANFRKQYNIADVSSYTTLYDETLKTLHSEDLKAFDLNKESQKNRERYGMDNFGQGLLLTRRLIDSGVPVVEVSFGSWDFHNDIQDNMSKKSAILDKALAALFEDLIVNGKIKDTVISVVSEFGRTSFYKDVSGNIISYNLNKGRDHQAQAFSAMIGGCNLGGKIIGATDDLGSKVIDRPVTFGELNATIGYMMGIKHDQTWMTPVSSSAPNRPMRVGNGAEAIKELVGM